jgi:hypothetical protein
MSIKVNVQRIKEYLIRRGFQSETDYKRRFIIASDTCIEFFGSNDLSAGKNQWYLDTSNLENEFKVLFQSDDWYGHVGKNPLIISNLELMDLVVSQVLES